MNSVSLIGRLTKDPEVRYSSGSQTTVAKFTLAVNRPFAKEGEQDADFIRVTCFGKSAELIEKYVSKGRLVGVTGRIQTGSYEKDGQKVFTQDVIVDRVEFLDKASGDAKANAAPKDDGIPEGFTQLSDDDIPF